MVSPRFTPRHQYDLDDEHRAGDATITHFDDPSLTNQQFTADVNLNVMMKRMGVTDGAIPPGLFDPALFGDFTEAPSDLTDAFARIRAAEDLFQQLPAEIRSKFQHNPAAMLTYLNDPANHAEAIELGLLHTTKPAAATPDVAPPAS